MKKFRLPVVMTIGCLTALAIVAMVLGWEQVALIASTGIVATVADVIKSDEKTANGG